MCINRVQSNSISSNRIALSLILSTLNGMTSAIQDGEYDSSLPKEALVRVCLCVGVCAFVFVHVSVCVHLCMRVCVYVCNLVSNCDNF